MILSLHDKLVNFTVQKWFIITPFLRYFTPFPDREVHISRAGSLVK
jgi:hypothetical protein